MRTDRHDRRGSRHDGPCGRQVADARRRSPAAFPDDVGWVWHSWQRLAGNKQAQSGVGVIRIQQTEPGDFLHPSSDPGLCSIEYRCEYMCVYTYIYMYIYMYMYIHVCMGEGPLGSIWLSTYESIYLCLNYLNSRAHLRIQKVQTIQTIQIG